MRALNRSCPALGLLLGGLLLGLPAARAVTVEQIPRARPGGWAVDLTGTLPPESLAELNQLGDEVQAKTGTELAVVVVDTTDGIESHAFATRLFNAWRIGHDGLLVFAALADHRAEIVFGRGLDGERSRRESAAVMREDMIPRFRAGDPAGAVVQGALGCARRLLGVSPLTAGMGSEAAAASPPAGTPVADTLATTPPRARPWTPASDGASFHGIDASDLIGIGFVFSLALLIAFFVLRPLRSPAGYTRSTPMLENPPSSSSASSAAAVASALALCASSSAADGSSSPSPDAGFSGGDSSGGGASGSW